MPHFHGQHDAPPEPVRLHEDHAAKLDAILPYLDKLHDKIDALHAKWDAHFSAQGSAKVKKD